MRKALAASAVSFALVAGQVNAGGMAEPIMEQEIVQETAQGSRAGILVPILALILFTVALTRDDGPDA